MKLLLDTDVCIDYLKGQSPATSRIVGDVVRGDLDGCCSVITFAEVIAGCRNARERAEADALLNRLTILPAGLQEAESAGQFRQQFGQRGLRTPDAFIAATAVQHGLSLLTRNTRHFRDIPGLALLGSEG